MGRAQDRDTRRSGHLLSLIRRCQTRTQQTQGTHRHLHPHRRCGTIGMTHDDRSNHGVQLAVLTCLENSPPASPYPPQFSPYLRCLYLSLRRRRQGHQRVQDLDNCDKWGHSFRMADRPTISPFKVGIRQMAMPSSLPPSPSYVDQILSAALAPTLAPMYRLQQVLVHQRR